MVKLMPQLRPADLSTWPFAARGLDRLSERSPRLNAEPAALTRPSLPACRNLLVNALDPDDLPYLAPHLERVSLDEGQVIVAPGAPLSFVHFPEGGVISLADVLQDGTRIDVGVVGRDGMTGSSLLLGCDRALQEAVVRVGGSTALRVAADRFRALCARSPAANALFLRFIHVQSVQTGRTFASHLRDPAEKCLSRWLLMFHDRIETDMIRLTHKQVAGMLGVRRATVTDSLHILEGLGAIKSSRGCIVVRDRALLEASAGGSYGFAEHHYRWLIAPFGKDEVR